MSVEKLFTDYADAINAGKLVDADDYIRRCPVHEREELKRLMATLQLLKNSTVAIPIDSNKIDKLFAHLEQRRLERLKIREAETKMVANFRAEDNLPIDEKKKVDGIVDDLWKKIFEKEE